MDKKFNESQLEQLTEILRHRHEVHTGEKRAVVERIARDITIAFKVDDYRSFLLAIVEDRKVETPYVAAWLKGVER